jgi:hypothetical protein
VAEMRKVNSKVQNMRLNERRTFEKERYKILKEQNEGTTQPDGSVVFYVISAKWVEKWRSYICQDNQMPGEIDNTDLKSYIQYMREERGVNGSQPLNDDDI